ncbi:MAG: MBL fold metallo-hydrolase [Chthoniobacteraceae bacterium]
MFHVTILGSGSAGNCALVESATARVLLDGGLSAKQMRERLALCGVDPTGIDAILLTHEHSDHACGIEVWCKQFGTPVYANGLTAEALRRATSDSKSESKTDWRVFTTGGDFEIKDITVQTFSVPHDAMDPVGFMLHHGGESLGFLTDLGFATKLACERVRQAHTLLIEANHDEKMLQLDTRRPWSTKQRIMSRHGHLSNAAAAAVLAEMLGGNLRRAVLGHLSRDCNSPELAARTVSDRLTAAGAAAESVEVFVATQKAVSPRFAVGCALTA